MGTAKTLLSAEEFDDYPFEEDKRYELDEGDLIEMTGPTYRHNVREIEVWIGATLPGRALIGGDLLASSLLPWFILTLDTLFA